MKYAILLLIGSIFAASIISAGKDSLVGKFPNRDAQIKQALASTNPGATPKPTTLENLVASQKLLVPSACTHTHKQLDNFAKQNKHRTVDANMLTEVRQLAENTCYHISRR